LKSKVFFVATVFAYVLTLNHNLIAQENSSEETKLSFLEFVGLMARAEDVWITPLDLRDGFSIEPVESLSEVKVTNQLDIPPIGELIP
jgi:hypothetical protein